MSRPKPNVLIEHTNKATYKSEQVLASEGVWAVFYDSKPINLKTSNLFVHNCAMASVVFSAVES